MLERAAAGTEVWVTLECAGAGPRLRRRAREACLGVGTAMTGGRVRGVVRRIRVAIALLGAVGIAAWASNAEPSPDAREQFFANLLLGGVVRGEIYLELPMADMERFLRRAVLSGRPTYCHGEKPHPPLSPYGGWSCRQIDHAYINSAVSVKIGEIVQVRTPDGVTSARVIRHEILGFDAHPGTLIVAVAEPHPPAAVADARLVIAARRLPACRAPCVLRKPGPHQTIASRVRTLFPRGPGQWEREQAELRRLMAASTQKVVELIIVDGHFTARERRQYVVYARYRAEAGSPIPDDWQTVILDSDLSVGMGRVPRAGLHLLPREAWRGPRAAAAEMLALSLAHRVTIRATGNIAGGP